MGSSNCGSGASAVPLRAECPCATRRNRRRPKHRTQQVTHPVVPKKIKKNVVALGADDRGHTARTLFRARSTVALSRSQQRRRWVRGWLHLNWPYSAHRSAASPRPNRSQHTSLQCDGGGRFFCTGRTRATPFGSARNHRRAFLSLSVFAMVGPSAARCSRSQDRVRSFKQSLIAGARPSEAERRELLLRIDGLAAQVSFLLGAILCSGLQS
jgi:hypothetical protein